jgi:hypothetical protein
VSRQRPGDRAPFLSKPKGPRGIRSSGPDPLLPPNLLPAGREGVSTLSHAQLPTAALPASSCLAAWHAVGELSPAYRSAEGNRRDKSAQVWARARARDRITLPTTAPLQKADWGRDLRAGPHYTQGAGPCCPGGGPTLLCVASPALSLAES